MSIFIKFSVDFCAKVEKMEKNHKTVGIFFRYDMINKKNDL